MNKETETFAKKCGMKKIQKPGFRPSWVDHVGIDITEQEIELMRREIIKIVTEKNVPR